MATASSDEQVQRAMLHRLHDDVERYDRRTMLVLSAAVLLIGLCLPMSVLDVTGHDGTRLGWLPEVAGANGWAVAVLLIGFGLVVATLAAAVAPDRRLLLVCVVAAGAFLAVTMLLVAGVGSQESTGRYGEMTYTVTLGLCPMVAGGILTGVSAARARSILEA